MAQPKDLRHNTIPKGKYDKKKVATQVLEDFISLQADRQSWVNKRQRWVKHWDDFVTKHTRPAFQDGSSFHIPLTFAQMKAIKAKLLRSLFQLNPPFFVRPTEQTDQSRLELVRILLDYTLRRYINKYKGIFKEAANWIQDGIVEGFSIAKIRWERQVRTFMDVEETKIVDNVLVTLEDGTQQYIPVTRSEFQEVEKEEVVFDGPIFETISLDDFFMPKAGVDLDEADVLIHRLWMSKSDLLQHSKNGFFDPKIVKKILDQDPDGKKDRGNDGTREIELVKDRMEGIESVNAASNRSKHEILEWYGKYDINEDGIDEEVVFWLHKATGEILRWTYLDRVFKSGKKPFFKFDFLAKPRNLYSMGLVELMYPLNVELDAMHNLRVDAGKFLIPFGVYRAASGLKPDQMQVKPGTLIPVDDVVNDIRFIDVPKSAVIFGHQEEAALLQHAERLVAISDLQFGRVSETQSATRTAFGVATLTEESNIQIDMLLRYLYDAWGQVLKAIFQLLQSNMPIGLTLRVTGEVGEDVFKTVQSRDEIKGNYDFEVTANTLQLNKEISRQNLLQAFQLGMNPLLLQMGITSPSNIYNMLVQLYKSYDIMEISKFVTKPQDQPPPIEPLQAMTMISQGLMPPIQLHDNHQEAIKTAIEISQTPEFLAVAADNPAIANLLTAYVQAHEQMQSIIQAQAQMQNVTGMQISPNLASNVAASNAGIVTQNKASPQQNPPAGRISGEEPNDLS